MILHNRNALIVNLLKAIKNSVEVECIGRGYEDSLEGTPGCHSVWVQSGTQTYQYGNFGKISFLYLIKLIIYQRLQFHFLC
jgi:hypothetical protein